MEISARKDGNLWVIAVSDNGIGIAPSDQERIFEVFQRIKSEDQVVGTGIGLAVCRRIVRRHGGTIWVESQPQHGSVFCFTIPDSDAD